MRFFADKTNVKPPRHSVADTRQASTSYDNNVAARGNRNAAVDDFDEELKNELYNKDVDDYNDVDNYDDELKDERLDNRDELEENVGNSGTSRKRRGTTRSWKYTL